MAKAVAKLGKFLTVRQDGKGDFKSIQAAIDAAPPNSLIEIGDSGLYEEALNITKAGLTLRGHRSSWPVIVCPFSKATSHVAVAVAAERTILEHMVVLNCAATGEGVRPAAIESSLGVLQARCMLVYSERGEGVRTCSSCEIDGAVIISPRGAAVRDGIARGPVSFVLRNCLVASGSRIGPEAKLEMRFCTFPRGSILVQRKRSAILDSICASVSSYDPDLRIEHSNLDGKPPVGMEAKLGPGCMIADPQFRDPDNLDYRLKRTSPCRGKASDGGDIGCRFTPEMLEVLKKAFELRKKGIIKF